MGYIRTSRNVRPRARAAVGLLLAACALGCRPGEPAGEPATGEAVEPLVEAAYVGDETCATCHEELYASYHRTGMGRSVSVFDPATAPERFEGTEPIYNAAFDYYYEPFVRGDTLYQREYRLDATGARTHEREHAARWVIGSGNATRSYLMEVNGHVTEMPLTWYVDRQRWDLSPGYEATNFRFARPIRNECMTCHNGLPEHSAFTDAHYTAVPLGITCERCHGPGEAHVDAHLSGLDLEPDEPDATIVNPAHLDRDLQLSTCQQCHLTGTTAYAPGEGPESYRPGTPIEAHRAVFVPAEQRADPARFGISSHAERLAQSACFQQTAMTCTTCHDPHVSNRELGADVFDATCQGCHDRAPSAAEVLCSRPGVADPALLATGNCTGCHMQTSGTSDIPHVTFTDHWIRRQLPPAAAPEEAYQSVRVRTEPVQLERLTTSRDPDDPWATVEEAIAYFRFYEEHHQHPEYLPHVARLVRSGLAEVASAEGALTLGRALLEQDSLAAAAAVLADARARYPERADLPYWLGQVHERRGRFAEAATAYEAAVALQPHLIDARFRQGHALLQAGQAQLAESVLMDALDRDPVHHPSGWNNLGMLYLQQRRLEQAEAAFERALALDPDLVEARVNLGGALLVQQRIDAAERAFRLALASDSTHAPALGNLSLIHAQRGETAEAIVLLQRLLRVTPGDARARALLRQLQQASSP